MIIKGINDKISCTDNSYLKNSAPTYKKIMLDCLHMDRGNGEDALRATKLGMFINSKDGELHLNDEDYQYLKDKINRNPAGYPNFALGDLLLKLEVSENV